MFSVFYYFNLMIFTCKLTMTSLISYSPLINDNNNDDNGNQTLYKQPIDMKRYLNKERMSQTFKDYLQDIHQQQFQNKRTKSFNIKKFLQTDKNLSQQHRNIIEAAKIIFSNNRITNINTNNMLLEFQQLNCFGKDKVRNFNWHNDNNVVLPGLPFSRGVYTLIFYIRKDSTVKGGDFEYKKRSAFFGCPTSRLEILEGDILIFDGSIRHRATQSYGFGCRDLITVFAEKL